MTNPSPRRLARSVMAGYLKLYLATLTSFLAIDMIWLGLVASSFYRTSIGSLMAPRTNWFAAILFYLLFVVGILAFVVLPGLRANSLKTTLSRAALYGLVTYATYDLTNLATLRDWPALLTLVDMTWGTVLSILVGWIGFLAGKRLTGREIADPQAHTKTKEVLPGGLD